MICPRAKRPTSRRRSLRVAALALLAAAAPLVAEDAADDPTPAELRGEIAGFARLARKAADENKWPLADHFLQLLADVDAPAAEKKNAFREMAEAYENGHASAKAIAVYEKMLEVFARDGDAPQLLFKLGLLYRGMGANNISITRFYSVLNVALQVDGHGFEASRALAKKAQWEIADTYFLSGNHAQARKFYDLLSRLELPPEEQTRVRFKLAHCLFLLGDLPAATTAAQAFIEESPDHASAPECRYILAAALRAQHRPKEACDTVLTLLREEKSRKEKAPEQWIYWQKKAGNEFANEYYSQGEYLNAMTIYQALVGLSDDPDWQWPVVYQMGLCFERLKLTERAVEAYKFIIDESKKPGRDLGKLADTVRVLPETARWRGEQLAWRHDTDAQLARVLGPLPAGPETP